MLMSLVCCYLGSKHIVLYVKLISQMIKLGRVGISCQKTKEKGKRYHIEWIYLYDKRFNCICQENKFKTIGLL